ncbi:MAG: hypothetical protein HGA78_10940 [Nitrospirales bacterium]|nr:hypothetical protein [Nitrospirales bacterium]
MTKQRQKFFSIALTFSLCAFFLGGCGPQQFRTDMFQVTEMAGKGAEGLTWNGRDLVVGSERLIFFLSSFETSSFIKTGSLYNSDGSFIFSRDPLVLTSSRPIRVCGLAWESGCCGDGYLWVANSLGNDILKVSMKNEIVASIPFPGTQPLGLVYDGKDLWAADAAKGKIYRLSPEGKVLQEIVSPVSSPRGLAWDCSQLWVVGLDSCTSATQDCNPARLLRLNPQTGAVTREMPLPRQIAHPSSMVWVSGNLWIADSDLNRVFKIADSEPAPQEDP